MKERQKEKQRPGLEIVAVIPASDDDALDQGSIKRSGIWTNFGDILMLSMTVSIGAQNDV